MALAWVESQYSKATNMVEYNAREYYRNFPTVLLTMVMPSGGRGAKSSSGLVYYVAAPYVGLFHKWGASWESIGVG